MLLTEVRISEVIKKMFNKSKITSVPPFCTDIPQKMLFSFFCCLVKQFSDTDTLYIWSFMSAGLKDDASTQHISKTIS